MSFHPRVPLRSTRGYIPLPLRGKIRSTTASAGFKLTAIRNQMWNTSGSLLSPPTRCSPRAALGIQNDMEAGSTQLVQDEVAEVYRRDSRRVFATLVRVLGDFDLAEEAMHEAFAAAIEQWREQGTPENPRAWLVSTGRFKAIDIIRRRSRFQDVQGAVAARQDTIADTNAARADHDIEDDRLRLIFTCCHPAIAPDMQIPLTLREVCGLSTEEIASAFLTSPATMAQRIVRGKAKIREAGIPFVIPALPDLPERLESVLSVIYLVFNEGYSASRGESAMRVDLSDEAIRLCRQVLSLLPDPEVMGLLALMLLHESRRSARSTADGEIVLLENQDRSRWNRELIDEGQQLVEQALASGNFGVYTIQAAISAVHSEAATASATDWGQIVALYGVLLQAEPSPIVELNRAVAVAMHEGPSAGLALIDGILGRGELSDYHLAHSARGELLRRMGRFNEARESLNRALELSRQEPERRLIAKTLREMP
jgi:RNA polymerase sigma-70 factor (ECF subfamily)